MESNKALPPHKRVDIEAEKLRRKKEDDFVARGKDTLSRVQLAINQVLSGKRIDVTGVAQSVPMDDVELTEVSLPWMRRRHNTFLNGLMI